MSSTRKARADRRGGPRAGALVLMLLAGACGKSSGQDTTVVSPSASAPASSAPVASASAAASGSASTVASRSLRGTYKTAPGSLAVTPDWTKTRFAGHESTAGLGEGAMTVQVDGSGRVTGTLDGALGAAVLEGTVAGDQMTAAIRRKDPSDRGFAGTLIGTLAADKATGTMSLASAEGGVVRTGTFTLSPEPAH